MTPPSSASPSGEAINELYLFVGIISIAILLLVEVLLVVFIVQGRRRRREASERVDALQVHGNRRLELLWTAVPILLVIAIAVVTFIKVPAVEADDEPEVVVRVQGHQFYWQYTFANGVIAVDELRLPVDRRVRLELTAADVIHSWWVPALTGKRDAVPGQVNELNFTPTRTGTFGGRCGEFCGIQHTVMSIRVSVLPQDAFDEWLAAERRRQEQGRSALGRETYVAACAKCHGAQGEGDIGPAIAGNPLLGDRDALANLVRNGQYTKRFDTYMPPVGLGWGERQVDALLTYLRRTLVPSASGTGTESGS